MRSLADCLKIHGANLDSAYRKSIIKLATENKRSGYEAHQAEMMAVASVMDTVKADGQAIFNQLERVGPVKERKDDLRTDEQRDKTESKRRSVQERRLEEIATQFGAAGQTEAVIPTSKAEKAFREVAGLFGLDAVFFRTNNDIFKSVGGFMDPNMPSDIFVNTENQKPLEFLVGHETLHQLRVNHPDLYNFLKDQVIIPDKNFRAYVAKHLENWKGSTATEKEISAAIKQNRDYIMEELLSDFAGDQFKNPAFWKKMAGKNKSFTQQIIDVINKILDRITRSDTYGTQYIKNFQTSQDALVSAMSAFADRAKGFDSTLKYNEDRTAVEVGKPLKSQVGDAVKFSIDDVKWTYPNDKNIFGTVNNRLTKELEIFETLSGPSTKAEQLPGKLVKGKRELARSVGARDLGTELFRLKEEGVLQDLIDPKVNASQTYKKLKLDDKVSFKKFKTELDHLRSGPMFIELDEKGKPILSQNGKAGMSADFLLATCQPTMPCKECYAASAMIRVSNVRKAFRNTAHIILDPKGWAARVAKEVSRVPKAQLPFIRLLGSGDLTSTEMVEAFNELAKKADRPIQIFSRHHDNLRKLKGTKDAPFIKMGSIDQDLYKHYGHKFLVENEKFGVANAWLLTEESEIASIKKLNKDNAIGLVLAADAKLHVKLPELLQQASCPCDADERSYMGSCRQCALGQSGCFMAFAAKGFDSDGKIYNLFDPTRPADKEIFPFTRFLQGVESERGMSPQAQSYSRVAADIFDKSIKLANLYIREFKAGKKKSIPLKDIRFPGDIRHETDVKRAEMYRDNLKKMKAEALKGTFELPGGEIQPGVRFKDGVKFSKAPPVETKAFKDWFKNSAIVDRKGNPLIVYHGTRAGEFTVFDKSKIGTTDHGFFGQGFSFTADQETAEGYADYDETGGRIESVYLSIQNPYVWPEGKRVHQTKEDANKFTERLKEQGYDGIVFNYKGLLPGDQDIAMQEIIAFEPTQIKSATGNVGTFDPTNPDIRFSKAFTEGLKENRKAAMAAARGQYSHEDFFIEDMMKKQKRKRTSFKQPLARKLGGKHNAKVRVPKDIASYVGDFGHRIAVGDQNVYFMASSEGGTIYLPNVAVDGKGAGLGTKFMNNLKDVADSTGQDIAIYKVTNPSFFEKFNWLEKDKFGDFKYTTPEKDWLVGVSELMDIWNSEGQPKFSKSATGRVQNFPVIRQDKNENHIVYETDEHRISVDKPGNAGTVVLWVKDSPKGQKWNKAGNLYTNIKTKKLPGETEMKEYISISSIEIEKAYRGEGLGKKMYQVLMDHAPGNVSGIISYIPDRANKRQVPAIYRSLGGYETGDWQVIPINKSPGVRFSKSRPENTQEFKTWSSNYDVLEGYEIIDAPVGEGLVFKVYHGTTNGFNIFDPTVKGTKEGQFGQVNYFTSDQGDADMNYAGIGPDLTNRIESRAERIHDALADMFEEDIQELAEEYGLEFDPETETYPADLPEALAMAELHGSDPQTKFVFVKADNPAFIGGPQETLIENMDTEQYREDAIEEVMNEEDVSREAAEEEYSDQIQDKIYEMAAYEEPAVLVAIREAVMDAGATVNPNKIYEEIELYDPDITATELEDRLRASEELMYADDFVSGELIQSHLIGQIFRFLGFDAIVLQNADQRFSGMDMGAQTAHVHVFAETPQNIKLASDVTYDDAGQVIPPEMRFSESPDIRFSKVSPTLAKKLEAGKKIKAFRAMQLIDGKLYPPMSAKVEGKLREPTEIGQWEQAEENPGLANDKGYFKLDKGNKKSIGARYNPYFHASASPLNDQFSSAYDRPNLVTVEVEIPASELTSGYKAEKAKDSVGEKNWHAGPVSSKMPKGKKRTVILSRYSKVIRVVPDREVAQKIADILKDQNIPIPDNVITPSLRNELQALGVPITRSKQVAKADQVKFSIAYHGTPYIWPPEPEFPHGRPRLDKIGTGEGAAAYGWGWYSAESDKVAGEYARVLGSSTELKKRSAETLKYLRKEVDKNADNLVKWAGYDGGAESLANAIELLVKNGRLSKKVGDDLLEYNRGLYKLDIPDSIIPKLLDWDSPLSEQSEYVKKAIKSLPHYDGYLTGGEYYNSLSRELGGKKIASERLREAGIPGNRYLDGMSRGKGKGSYNYVMWSQPVLDRISLLERNGEKLDQIRAEAEAAADQVKFSKTATNTPTFKKWFGKSEITNPDGSPRVVYHGTKELFSEFKARFDDRLYFFSTNPEFASAWAVGRRKKPEDLRNFAWTEKNEKELNDHWAEFYKKSDELYDSDKAEWIKQYDKLKRTSPPRKANVESDADAAVYPVYIRAEKMFNPEKDFKLIEDTLRAMPSMDGIIKDGRHKDGNWIVYENKAVIDKIESLGYDGIWLRESALEGTPTETIAVWNATQVKSATGNTGAFDPLLSDIRFSKTDPELTKAGQAEIDRIITRLRQYVKKDEMGVSESKTRKLATQYVNLKKKLADRHISTESKIKEFKSLLMQMPMNVRGKSLAGFNKLASVKNEETKERQFQKLRIQAEKEVNKHFKRETLKAINKMRKLKVKVKGHRKTNIGAPAARVLEYVNQVLTDPKLRSVAGQEEHIAKLKARLETLEGRESTPVIERQILNTKDKIEVAEVFGGYGEATLSDLEHAYTTLETLIMEGRTMWQLAEAERKAMVGEITNKVIQDVTGEENPEPETPAEKRRRESKEDKSTWFKIKRGLSNFDTLHQSWHFLLDKITTRGEGRTLRTETVELLGGSVHAATNKESELNQTAVSMIQNKLEELTGLKGRKLEKWVEERSELETEYSITSTDRSGKEKKETIPLSDMQAVYWWAINRRGNALAAEGFDSVNERLELMGVTPEFLKKVETTVDPIVLDLAEWLSDTMGGFIWQNANHVHEARYGASIPNSVDYTPIRADYNVGRSEADLLQRQSRGSSMIKGALHDLTSTKMGVKPANLLDVWTNHINDMNHFTAWAIPVQQLEGVFSNQALRNFIEQHYGKEMNGKIADFIEIFKGSPVGQKDHLSKMAVWRGRFSTAVLGLNPAIYIKQLASIPAMAADIPIVDWNKGIASFMANPKKAIDILSESQFVKTRHGQGHTRDVAAASAKSIRQLYSGGSSLPTKLMLLVRMGDMQAIYAGGWPVYKYYNDKYTSQGMSKSEAHKKALARFEQTALQTQQTGEKFGMSLIQQGSALQQLFTMFMSAPVSYYREVGAAIRNMKKAPKDSVKRLALFWVVVPALFSAIANAPLAFDDDDEDQELFWKRVVRDAVLGPISGLFFVRDIAKYLYNTVFLQEENWSGLGFSSMGQPVETVNKMLRQMVDLAEGEDVSWSDFNEDLIDIAGYTTGLPLPAAQNYAQGVRQIAKGETEHPIAKMMGYTNWSTGDKGEDVALTKFAKKKARVKKTADGLEDAEDKRAYRQEHREDLRLHGRIKALQPGLNKLRRRINDLKKKDSTEKREALIETLENRRTEMVRRFLEREKNR